MMKLKRAQAATEFLFTYGWALILIIVAIAVLIQMGILDLGSFVPTGTDVSGFNSFGVGNFKLHADGSIDIALTNKLERAVTIKEVRINGVSVSSPSPALPFTLNSSSTSSFSAVSSSTGSAGRSYSATVLILFDMEGGAADHLDSGTLRSEYQP